jgi:hypothetical protein
MVADTDGDGKAELIIWRGMTGMWFWTPVNGYSSLGSTGVQWGTQGAGDIPLLTDLDGDGRADLIVYRPSSGTWYWLKSSSGYNYGSSKQWGTGSDLPIVR